MDQPLDLSIVLTPPPPESSSEAIASISLRSDLLGLSHTGDLLFDPINEQDREDLRWYLEEYWKWPYEGFAQRGKQVEALLPELGRRLYKSVFGDRTALGIWQAWRLVPGAHRQISIVSDIPRVLSLPWELLHDEQGFLALRTRTPVSIVRRLPQSELISFSTPLELPLRILVITARPEGTGFIDPRSIARELLDEVQEQVEEGRIVIEFLRPPTLSALHARLVNTKRQPIHVLHFDGHGMLSENRDGQGLLIFEDQKGRFHPVKGGELAQILRESGIRLAVLTACQSALSAEDDAFSGIASQLIRGGVDAVAAMSSSVLVASATRYVGAFYRGLTAGTSVLTAQERALQALNDDPRRHLYSRHRDEESTPVELRDWWLPHYYQQRPLVLQPAKPGRRHKQQQPTPTLVPLNEGMPSEPRYGFSGRSYELLQLERWLVQGKLVVVHGFGGVGKTALVREIADWLTRTGMYAGACFISFEHGGDAALLLSALGNYLGVYDGRYNPNDKGTALARLGPPLKEKRILVIADNLESILPLGEAPLDAAMRTQLWDVLLELVKMGAGVLLTSRDTAFGDGWLPAKRVSHLLLGGLHPEDAYLLASNLLDDLGIARTRAPYAELRDLLMQLDHHPLAIQLVLPALRELTLSEIRADFSALFPRFLDDTVTGRNRSLLTSLDYSLRRLDEAQRGLLARLAFFEVGAMETALLAITGIPKVEWAMLRPDLERAALLTVEQVHEAVAVPFLRFHPVLIPYLRSQPGADDRALRDHYTRYYYALANFLYQEDDRSPQPVRALAEREMPNLRRALELLLHEGQAEEASNMADSIARFLTILGLLRERDQLRRQVATAMSGRASKEGILTRGEYLREVGAAEDEERKGDLPGAIARLTALLTRIESQSESALLSQGSFEHSRTLGQLARCLRKAGQPEAAEIRLHEALTIIDTLSKLYANEQDFLRQRGTLLTEYGNVLVDQGRFVQAREVYEEALKVDEWLGDLRNQAVHLGQLGTLALAQGDYQEARTHYTAALERFHYLGEPISEAVAWHQLGIVAERQQEWNEAERLYRQSLAIGERLGDVPGVATTCNQLAIVAQRTGRPGEAEEWYKRALKLEEQTSTGSLEYAGILSNLAAVLMNEVRMGQAPATRLTEARDYAERALAILKTLDASSGIWATLSVLAGVAEMEGRAEAAQDYRRRERESFAAFAGNRYHIDRQHRQLISDIAAAAKGDSQVQVKVEAALPQLEEQGWHITDAVRRIWAGEWDWHAMADGLDRQDALLILQVLETLANAFQHRPEVVLPQGQQSVETVGRGDATLLQRYFETFSPKKQEETDAEERTLEHLIDLAMHEALERGEAAALIGLPEGERIDEVL